MHRGAIYDSQAIRAFVGIDLGRESAPDATTLLKFRHLLESKELTRQIFGTINGHLAEKGLMMREGTIVDQEQGLQARSGDAPIEERQGLALRDESAHRR
jgi:IS5 family transposase